MIELSLLCVTRPDKIGHNSARYLAGLAARLRAGGLSCEFVLAIDQPPGDTLPDWKADLLFSVQSSGYLESILDLVISRAGGAYILRLDSDETLCAAAERWLISQTWKTGLLWAFPRANLYKSSRQYIKGALWPDLQTRLSTAELAGGRADIHAGSPHGTGALCPWPILHYKYLWRNRTERYRIAQVYEQVRPGAGFGEHYRAFGLPETIPGLLDDLSEVPPEWD